MFASSTKRSVSRLVAVSAPRRPRTQAWSTTAARGLASGTTKESSTASRSPGAGSVALPQGRESLQQQHRAFSMSALQEPPYDYISPPPAASPLPPPPASPAPGTGGKIVPFLLADIGEGIAEVELMQWFVREGESVKQFDRVCEVQSDKATVEISSRYDGIVSRVHHAVGAVVKVGSALVDIEVAIQDDHTTAATLAAAPTMNNADLPSPAVAAAAAPVVTSSPLLTPVSQQQQPQHHLQPPQPLPHLTPASSSSSNNRDAEGEIVPTTPAVRRLAKEYGVDLSLVRPTGPQGRVLKGDILDHINTRNGGGAAGAIAAAYGSPLPPAAAAASTSWSGAPEMIMPSFSTPPSPSTTTLPPSPAPSSSSFPLPPPPSPLSATVLTQAQRVPVRGVMRQMVKSMNASLKIPHFGYQDEVCMDKAAEFRASLRPLAEAQGVKFTYLPLMLKAASLALLRFPILNSSLSEDEKEVIYHASHEIGVAMATSKGLVVPVLRRVQEKSLMEIARELAVYQQKAEWQGGREGGLGGQGGGFKEEDFQEATFSLSNIGSLGGTYMSAKIVPPQVAIGAVGRIQTLPRFVSQQGGREGGMEVVPVRMMAISWAGDHRVVDGATMARFSNLWKMYLEEPAMMLAETR